MRSVAPPVGGTLWLNTDPIGPEVWRGRTTLLVFWTMGCEASQSLLHRLERLHQKSGGELAIIAVHSPRFADGQDADRLRREIARSGLTIPVLHDPKLTTWGRYNPPGWPAVVLINHRGHVIASGAGVGTSILAEAIDQTRQVAAVKRAINNEKIAHGKRAAPAPLPIPAALPSLSSSSIDRLRHPSGLAVAETPEGDGLLAVVDSGNDRLLLLELDPDAGEAYVVDEVGGFHRPSQVCSIGANTLAVSEPDLGRVVGLDLQTKNTWTISNSLVRPTGLMVDLDGSLVVADAGADKLVRFINLEQDDANDVADQLSPAPGDGTIAGSGTTGCDDGDAGRATLAQPISLVRSGKGVAFVDLASGALRVLTDGGKVLTSSNASFRESGLIDGPVSKAMFDRPRAITRLSDGSLIVADSGTSRLRRIHERRVSTLGAAGLNEPEALLALGTSVLVADTGNHRLVMVDLEGRTVRPININGLVPHLTTEAPPIIDGAARRSRETVTPDDDPTATITVPWPATGAGPWTITVTSQPSTLIDGDLTFERSDPADLISVPLADTASGSILVVATGVDNVDAASFRIDTDSARSHGRIQRPIDDEPVHTGRSSTRQKKRQAGKKAMGNSIA